MATINGEISVARESSLAGEAAFTRETGRRAASAADGGTTADVSGRGLEFPAVFALDPEPIWRQSTAEITRGDGTTVFRQDGVEFPSGFSQTAVNVVASKYFHGDGDAGNGSPRDGKREYSFEQLVNRVVGAIREWGEEDGYFASPGDAERFERSLRGLLIGQYAAFNSPVWFNCGVWRSYGVESDVAGWRWDAKADAPVKLRPGEAYKYPGLSACFIQSVDDTMESIMDLAKAEAMLFKNGSGTGSDLSTLRSTREKLSGGGRPSGPVSFFRIYDAVGGAIKSGGRSRRAARMQTLHCEHPDILEFVECKVKEDRKARALIAAGWSAGMTGSFDEAYSSVAFQNTNISPSLTDVFMRKATGENADPRYWTRAVVDGSPVEKLDAREVLDRIAAAAWECGDPGPRFHDTTNAWNVVADTAELHSTNPCGEFSYINDSACNLASINLTKFLTDDGRFLVESFKRAVRVTLIAQDILVDHAGYPTEKIARNSHEHRPLGLGIAALGSLLMRMGVPYDSDAGRSIAGGIMAVMQGAAAAASSEMAAALAPYPAYEANRASSACVMAKHAGAVSPRISDSARHRESADVWAAARALWRPEVVAARDAVGYRNAQFTVAAPTGTISFMMDCQTTGIEPALGLTVYKKLSGGGDLSLVNGDVPLALKALGYPPEDAAAIVAKVAAGGRIEDADEFDGADLAVFDCAFAASPGGRTISPDGHLRMMAALQPFISGALSKTVNIPEHYSVADVRDIFVKAWRLGLKSVTVYRDGSKGVQPLTTTKPDAAAPPVPAAPPPGPRRERLPDTRAAINHKFSVGGHEGYANVGRFPDGRPGELFVTMAKEGSTVGGLMDVVGTLTSICLQYGVPLEVLVNKLSNVRFEPQGFTKNPDVPIAASVVDYIFRWMGAEFVPGWREENCPRPADAVEFAAAPGVSGGAPDDDADDRGRATPAWRDDAPACPECGSITVRAGACHACPNCGATTGCG